MSDPARIQSTATEPNHRAQPLHTRCTATEHSHRTPIALPASSLHYHLYCLLNLLHCLVVLALFPCCTASPSHRRSIAFAIALSTASPLHHPHCFCTAHCFASSLRCFLAAQPCRPHCTKHCTKLRCPISLAAAPLYLYCTTTAFLALLLHHLCKGRDRLTALPKLLRHRQQRQSSLS
ncbi:hypothetical protein ACFX2B_019964 [Malus domestica]